MLTYQLRTIYKRFERARLEAESRRESLSRGVLLGEPDVLVPGAGRVGHGLLPPSLNPALVVGGQAQLQLEGVTNVERPGLSCLSGSGWTTQEWK